MYSPNSESAHQVQAMFARIAQRYDLMNMLMTGGQDMRWRRRLLDQAKLSPGAHLLDIGTGTGDIATAALKCSPGVISVGADFTVEMMQVGMRSKAGQGVFWVGSDALELPFPKGSFDAVVSGFLIRNVVDLPRALGEQYRVLRPGGRIVCLDTTPPPDGWLRPLITFHMHTVIPVLGGWISGHRDAYAYLSGSTENFLPAEVLAEKMRAAGFNHVGFQRVMFQTVALHWGIK